MISKQDIEKLANLSRLSLSDSEKEFFPGEIDAILGYVAHINSLSSSVSEVSHVNVNTLRDDVVVHGSNEFSESLLANAPQREGQYVKVKKIIE